MRTKVMTLGLICLLMTSCALSVRKEKFFNPWQGLFTEPLETLYIIMEDRVAFKCSTQDEIGVRMTLGKLEKQLQTKERSYKIEDIAVVIHNHYLEQEFSPADWRLYGDLKRRGFNGRFLLYCYRTNKTYDIEDKKKSN